MVSRSEHEGALNALEAVLMMLLVVVLVMSFQMPLGVSGTLPDVLLNEGTCLLGPSNKVNSPSLTSVRSADSKSRFVRAGLLFLSSSCSFDSLAWYAALLAVSSGVMVHKGLLRDEERDALELETRAERL